MVLDRILAYFSALAHVHVVVDQGEQVVAIRAGGIAEIHHGHLIAIAVPGNTAIISRQIPLRVQGQETHAAGAGIFQIWV